jgi:hypothetical protein
MARVRNAWSRGQGGGVDAPQVHGGLGAFVLDERAHVRTAVQGLQRELFFQPLGGVGAVGKPQLTRYRDGQDGTIGCQLQAGAVHHGGAQGGGLQRFQRELAQLP